jgi:hypothetical protein
MASSQTSSTQASCPIVPRSWADVARRAASAFEDCDVDAQEEEQVPLRPWRQWSGSVDSDSSFKPGFRPWREVAERMTSAFEQSSSEDESDAEESVESGVGSRGSRRVFCYGEVLTMMGHYGWLMASETIDDPAALKNDGHIYVHSRDIARGASLVPGDRVSFYLYADEQGLGAEDCRLQEREESAQAAGSEVSGFRGWNPHAADFVPSVLQMPCPPMPATMVASGFNVMAVNLDDWSDDSDSDASESSEASSGIDAGMPSSRGSSASTGVSSDSESSGHRRRRKQGVMMVSPPVSPPPGLGLAKHLVAPPPGLSLQVGSVPLPPGLGFEDELIPVPPGLA